MKLAKLTSVQYYERSFVFLEEFEDTKKSFQN